MIVILSSIIFIKNIDSVESSGVSFNCWFWLTNKVEEKPKVFADDAIQCDECGSIRIVKYGFDCGKQTYYCKDCHKKFREHSILRKVKFTPELITLCLDLYFSGLSLRKISRNIGDHFSVEIITILQFMIGFKDISHKYQTM